MVAQHRTRRGTCDVMRQNPHNAVLSLGHANGTVSLWSPNITTSLVKMLCHRVRHRIMLQPASCRLGERQYSVLKLTISTLSKDCSHLNAGHQTCRRLQ